MRLLLFVLFVFFAFLVCFLSKSVEAVMEDVSKVDLLVILCVCLCVYMCMFVYLLTGDNLEAHEMFFTQ